MPRGRPRKNQDVLLRSAELIGWALGGLEREISLTRERLSSLTAQANTLRARVSRGASKVTAAPPAAARARGAGGRKRRRRRQMSADARKRISEMMKKRWADTKKKGLKRL